MHYKDNKCHQNAESNKIDARLISRDMWLSTHHNGQRSSILCAAMEFISERVKHTAI